MILFVKRTLNLIRLLCFLFPHFVFCHGGSLMVLGCRRVVVAEQERQEGREEEEQP
jgi:hypothetical protein